jgi:hypothetical protein
MVREVAVDSSTSDRVTASGCNPLISLVGGAGFEPAASAVYVCKRETTKMHQKALTLKNNHEYRNFFSILRDGFLPSFSPLYSKGDHHGDDHPAQYSCS